jgi:uncharacterized protein YggE
VKRKKQEVCKMKKIWLAIIGVVLLVGVLALAGCSSGGTSAGNVNVNLNSQQQGIWVNGEGKVTVVPDMAILSLGIQAQSTSVAQAQSDAADAMDKVMTALKDQGVADKDIQTQYYNVQRLTRYDNDTQQEVTTGYQVTNTVTAKIRKVDTAGTVIDAVVAAGGDYTRVNSIGFTVDDPKPFQEQARELAVADAATKAKKLADIADVKLGKPSYISESSNIPTPIYRTDVMTKAEGVPAVTTPISAGEMDITTNVQIAYNIAN